MDVQRRGDGGGLDTDSTDAFKGLINQTWD